MSVGAKIYLVGAGPGRADWLTVRAAELLAEADAVVGDRLVSQQVLAKISPTAEVVLLEEDHENRDRRQLRILHLLEAYARRYRCVVRLKGGDPFVFGRGAEEWAWLVQRGWEVEVVPGVSSAIALPASAGIPPTFRGISSAFAVLTGCLRGGADPCWERYAQVDTLIILMGVSRRARIAGALIRAGRPSGQPCCFIENGATPRERIVRTTLGEVAAGLCDVNPPAVWVVGNVVSLKDQLTGVAPALSLSTCTAGPAQRPSAPDCLPDHEPGWR